MYHEFDSILIILLATCNSKFFFLIKIFDFVFWKNLHLLRKSRLKRKRKQDEKYKCCKQNRSADCPVKVSWLKMLRIVNDTFHCKMLLSGLQLFWYQGVLLIFWYGNFQFLTFHVLCFNFKGTFRDWQGCRRIWIDWDKLKEVTKCGFQNMWLE